MTIRDWQNESKYFRNWKIRDSKKHWINSLRVPTLEVASSLETVLNRCSRLKKSWRRSMKILHLLKKNWLPKFKKMKWSTLKSLKLKRDSKIKKSYLRSKLMIFKRRYTSLIRIFKKKKMNVLRSKKSLLWQKSKMIFSNKIIKLLSRNTTKINRNGPSFLSVLVTKWRSTSMSTPVNFQLILSNEIISSRRAQFLLKS